MAYTKQTWADLPSKTTPINAERLTHIEDGIFNAAQTADTAASTAGTAAANVGIVSGRVETLTGRVNDLDTAVSNKVDKVAGKGLSTNDYDDTDKGKVDSLGTASTKNSTSVVTESSDLVESGAVKDALGFGNKNLLNADVLFASALHHGINLSVSNQIISLNGTVSGNSGYYFGDANKKLTLPAGTYTFSIVCSGNFGTASEIRVRKSSDSSKIVGIFTNDITPVSFTLNADTEVFIAIVNSNATVGTSVNATLKIQLEKGTTATTYEPYHASVEEFAFPRSEQAVLGAKNWWKLENVNGSGTGVTFTLNADKTVSLSAGTTSSECYFPSGIGTDLYNLLPDTDFIVSYGKTAIANLQIQVLYKETSESSWATLASESSKPYCKFTTPSTLYKVWIRLLIANNKTVTANTLYPMIKLASDTSDDFVPYVMTNRELTQDKADNSVIAPTENGTTASQAYAVGSHFIRNGAFCTVTQAISSGGTLTEGTNYTSGNVASCLIKQGTFSGTTTGNGNLVIDTKDKVIVSVHFNDSYVVFAGVYNDGTNQAIHVTGTDGIIMANAAVSGTYYYI